MTPPKARRRFGVGGDYLPTDHEGDNHLAICAFLSAVDQKVPECRRELIELAPLLPHNPTRRPSRRTTPRRIRQWARKWEFTSRLLVDIAINTANTARLRHGRDTPWVVSGAIWEPDFLEMDSPLWNPIHETEAGFRARVEGYINTTKSTPGILPAPIPRQSALHFGWLALHQVAGLSLSAIAEKTDEVDRDGRHATNIDAISKGITRAAQLVGLTLRAAPNRRRR